MNWALEFIPNPSDQSEGIDGDYLATFRGTPYASTARECGQNTSDASQPNSDPAELHFDLIEIPASELPCLDEYKSVISLCLNKAKRDFDEDPDDKSISILSQAKRVISRNTIQVLRIADYNTTGLVGPDTEGNPFHTLLKGSSVSSKAPDKTGSYGIGKIAVFAVSAIQTVFYSTIYKDPQTGNDKFLTQARSSLISHEDEKGEKKRCLGYCGAGGFKPVDDINSVPEWLRRDGLGASIFAIGFRSSEDWLYRMAASLLINFYCALWNEKIKFKLNGELEINKTNVVDLFNHEKIIEVAQATNIMEEFVFSKSLLECLVSKEAIEKKISVQDLGVFSIRILMREGLPRRVAIVRNGMMIADNLKNFGDRFARFPMYSDFVALVQPLDEKGCSIIRTLENPSHNELSAERITNEEKQKKITKAMVQLAKKIRTAIKEEAVTEPEDEVDLDELSEFFGDTDDSDKLPDSEGEDDPETQRYTRPKTKKRQSSTTTPSETSGEEGGAGHDDGSSGGDGGGEGPGTGSGTGGRGNRGYAVPTRLEDVRNLIPDGNTHKRRVMFTPRETCRATISILASGLSYNDDLVAVATQEGKIENGRLALDFNARERKVFDVEFEESYDGPIEIQASKHVGGNSE